MSGLDRVFSISDTLGRAKNHVKVSHSTRRFEDAVPGRISLTSHRVNAFIVPKIASAIEDQVFE